MQETLETTPDLTAINLVDQELHQKAKDYLGESYHLVFIKLPAIIAEMIKHEIWNKGNIDFSNFGEYVLDKSDEGLGVSNNNMLWLLRTAMDIEGQHAAQWGDVLNEVDESVKAFAKKNNIAMRDLSNRLNGTEYHQSEAPFDNSITYLPSKSKSNDGQLLKLRKQDEQAYNDVVSGKMKLKEALPPPVRKQVLPIETVKHKFNNLSNEDRIAFLAWLNKHMNGETD